MNTWKRVPGRAVSTGRSLIVLTALIAGLLGWSVSTANASQAGLVKVHGKSTLVVLGDKHERNTIHIDVERNRKYFTLEDNGLELPDYGELTLSYAPGSLPGCQVLTYGPDPTTAYLRCQVKRVRQLVFNLKDGDDLIQNGDGIQRWTELNRPFTAKLGSGPDIFNGGPRSDRVDGGPGKDIITTFRGNDVLIGGPGVDTLVGDKEYGLDRAPAGGGNDVMIGGGSRDYISPGSGRDRVSAGAGNDIVNSVIDRDRDIVSCGAGRNDSLLGINHRGIRFHEKAISGCETVSDGAFTGSLVWKCHGRRCVVRRH